MVSYIYIFVLLFIPAIFYTLATFYHLNHPHLSYRSAVLIAIFFASLEYFFKVPAIRELSYDYKISNFSIQAVWIVLSLVMAYTSSYFIHPKLSSVIL